MMKLINDFIKQFSEEQVPNIKKLDKKYYLVNEEIKELSNNIDEDPFALGLFLGEEDHKRFRPSCALIEIISKSSKKKVFIDDKAEWLFLCGRDIFGKAITKANVKKGLVLVQNKHDENLGYGRMIDLSQTSRIAVKNILDRGDFLRREKKKK